MRFSEIQYNRPDIITFEQKFDKLLKEFEESQSFEEQCIALEKLNEIRNDFQSNETIVSVRHSINTEDKYFEGEQSYFDEILPVYTGMVNRMYKALTQSKYKSKLKEKFGDQLFTIAELTVKTFEPEIIEDLQNENHLSTEYTQLVASANIKFDGQELNLTGLDPYTQSTDREVRKQANIAKFNFFSSNSEKFDSIFDKLVNTRNNISTKLGYKNFVELGYNRMLRSDYNETMVKDFREQVLEHVVPLTLKLKERQQKNLGYDKLHYYDLPLYFKSGNPKPKGKPQWIINNGKKMYSELSPETQEFFDFMIENEMMDLVNKKGKAAGGYCTMISKYRSPFIFSNFNGTSHDIDVLTHEAGHAFQVYSSRNFDVQEYFWPTYEACEIHSMSMEFFTWPWMELFFKEDTDKYKFYHLSSSLSFLPYGVSVDEFQHEIYRNPNMSPEERNAAWRKIEKKYTPFKDYDGNEYLENGAFWQRQAHIYNSPFYYIDYTLAQICAFQFWIRMQDDYKSAWKDYLTLCKAGGSKSFLELVKIAKLRSPFEKGVMEQIVKEIADVLNQMDSSKF